jgi:flagellar biosynthesis/type III secretory pathway protein FliH
MSRVLKSVNFEPDQSFAVEARGLALAAPPDLSGVDMAVSAADPGVPPDPLAEAQRHADMMLNQARTEAAAWQEEAQLTGWQVGYAEGRQAAQAELAAALTTARDLAQSAVEARAEFLRESRAEIGRLAVAIAEKIIGKELAVNPSAVTEIVAQVIDAAGVQGACRTRVNPFDYEILKPHWDAVAALQRSGCTWDLVADKRISRGGCLVEAGGGTLDARLEVQLAQVQAAFDRVSDQEGREER